MSLGRQFQLQHEETFGELQDRGFWKYLIVLGVNSELV